MANLKLNVQCMDCGNHIIFPPDSDMLDGIMYIVQFWKSHGKCTQIKAAEGAAKVEAQKSASKAKAKKSGKRKK